jgi:hypothetical protein
MGENSVANTVWTNMCWISIVPQKSWAIELDGEQHFTDGGLVYDEKRTNYLNSLNISVRANDSFPQGFKKTASMPGNFVLVPTSA